MTINILTSSTRFYWGVLPEAELRDLNFSISKLGFIQATSEFNFSQRFDYATDLDRANLIKFLFPEKYAYRVLEIGCGYGNLTIELAKKFDSVDSVDAVYESLVFTQHRLEFEECSNVQLYQTNVFEDKEFLKHFEDNVYDLIVINGVLEWVGSGVKTGNPRMLQKQFLDLCNAKLNSSGLLFLAIENRYYPGWVRRDPHSKLPLTAIAPRKIANFISVLLSNRAYRTYIYGYRALIKMLRSSGFFLNSKVYVYHSYRRPILIFQNNSKFAKEFLSKNKNNKLSSKWKLFIRYGISLKLIDLLIPTFTHVYTKKSNSTFELKNKYAYTINGNFEIVSEEK